MISFQIMYKDNRIETYSVPFDKDLNKIKDSLIKDSLLNRIKFNLDIVEYKLISETNVIDEPNYTILERWIRKLPKDKWNDKLETKLCSLSSEYATNQDREIFWISAMNKIDSGLQHKLVWKLHIDRTMNITEYNKICLLETVDKVISDEEFYKEFYNTEFTEVNE